jgi:hypothetical protein
MAKDKKKKQIVRQMDLLASIVMSVAAAAAAAAVCLYIPGAHPVRCRTSGKSFLVRTYE